MDIFFISEIMLIVTMMGVRCNYYIFIIVRRSSATARTTLHGAIKWA